MLMTRRHLLALISSAALPARAAQTLPQSLTFVGAEKFDQIVARAASERWSALSLPERMTRAALAMQGTPYVGFTLEIHDHIESPSANFHGLDCWTFFEIALGFGRMFGRRQSSYSPTDLLHEIEITRYRGGVCNGNYLDRIHYLEEWFRDNHARGHVRDITRSLATTQKRARLPDLRSDQSPAFPAVLFPS